MVLVVGGAGYIGSHVCKLFREQDVEHLVFDNFEQGHRAALHESPFVVGDLRNPSDLERAMAAGNIDTVMHFGAYISVGESVREPGKYYLNNTGGVLNLLEAMRKFGIGQIVFSSTAAVYGEPDYVPIDEDHPKQPTSPYGDSKLAAERILEAFEKAHGVRRVVLRYFNAAGAHPDGSIGEAHHVEEHLIPLAVNAALGRRAGLKVFGSDYDTPDGTCVRDYIHVCDLADAHLLAVRHLQSGGQSRAFNLGNGLGFSVREVIDTVGRVGGKQVPHEDAPRRPGDPARLIASSDRIRHELRWSPKFPELDTIVQHAWEWHSSHPNGYA